MFIDSRDLRLLAVQGLTMAEIARELKQPYYRVRKSCQLYGVDVQWDVPGKPPKVKAPKLPKMPKAPKPPRVDQNAERNAKMVLMYRQGLTLGKIGDSFGLTRERVRQLLRKYGITPAEGGQHKAMLSKAAARQTKQDARYLIRHGLTFAEYKEVRGTGALHAYQNQERAANNRGIEWGLNLAQWLDIWRTSGKLEMRGRGKGKYVMSRIKDTGGYVVGNVHVQLGTDNSREAIKQWVGKKKTIPGVFHLYPGLATPYMAKVGKKYLGLFPTEDDAKAARVAYMAANGYRMTPGGTAYRKPTPPQASQSAITPICSPSQP